MRTLKLITISFLWSINMLYANDTLKVNQLIQKTANTHLGQIQSDANGKVKVQLSKVLIVGDSLFFKLKIVNRSNLNYEIDFIRFYVRDLKTSKRTVTQEQELYPIAYIDMQNNALKAGTSLNDVFVLKQFPISKTSALFIEVYEKSGSRHLYIKVKQKHILKAKAISSIFKQK